MKTRSLKTCSLLVLGALLIAPAMAWAQSESKSDARDKDSTTQRKRSGQEGQDDHSENRQRSAARSQQSGQSPSRSNQDRQAVSAHFRAGYTAGYKAGYVDAQDDYVLYIIDLQHKRKGQQGESRGQDSQLSQSDRQRLRAQMRGPTGGQAMSSTQQLRGEILKTKKVTLKNTNRQHTVVLLETDKGRRIADLGPSRNLGELQIDEGQKISVQGRFARTRDQVPVLLARRVQANGQAISVDRMRSASRSSSGTLPRSSSFDSQRRSSQGGSSNNRR
jgi:hypothetical protein